MLPAASQQLGEGMPPGLHPSWGCCGASQGVAVQGLDTEAPGISLLSSQGTPQTGSPLTLAGSGSRTGAGGVSSARWGTGGWGTTRSIQPSIPPPAGSEEGSPASQRPAAAVHALREISGAPAAHAVPRAAQKGPWRPSVSTSCLGNAALQRSQTKTSSNLDPSLLL